MKQAATAVPHFVVFWLTWDDVPMALALAKTISGDQLREKAGELHVPRHVSELTDVLPGIAVMRFENGWPDLVKLIDRLGEDDPTPEITTPK